MPTKNPVITMVFTGELLRRVEDYRYENRIPTRTEVIRGLLQEALKKYEKKRPQR
jgi:metal-responsive CopG/Arc/MetJ family transcriptional regulator